ncbi:MAG: WbqC family protein [Candidatus Omnitrophica bacterium]|jgi:hypothetical protein|nr:WbqC family protein [Candidatus Omnitrophota bacterium]
MILTAHQPVYLPWLGLFHKIALSDAFCYFDNVQYLKKDWNNRNMIKTPNGVIWLTVPVLTKGHREKPIRQIEINNSVDWRKKHWQSIFHAYRKAPFFNMYSDFFKDLYAKDWVYLTDLNEWMLKFFLKELNINVKYCKASDMNFAGSKSDLVLDMCVKLNAGIYIFGALGKEYADIASFKERGIKVLFQDYKHPQYPQLGPGFAANLSVIDLLFNAGPDRSLDIIMSGNITKQDISI